MSILTPGGGSKKGSGGREIDGSLIESGMKFSPEHALGRKERRDRERVSDPHCPKQYRGKSLGYILSDIQQKAEAGTDRRRKVNIATVQCFREIVKEDGLIITPGEVKMRTILH